MSFITNLIILFDKNITNPQKASSGIGTLRGDILIRNLGIVHIVLCGLVLILWGIFQATLEAKSAERKLELSSVGKNGSGVVLNAYPGRFQLVYYWLRRIFWNAYYMLFDTYLLYFVVMLTFSLLGTFFSKVFFAFLMFDIIDRSVILNNVVKSVTVNYKQLLMTVVLGIMLIYIYSVIGFYAVITDDPSDPTDDYDRLCTSVWHCFLSFSDQGLRAGGGIGELLSQSIGFGDPDYPKRYFFSLIYFLLIIIILLNIIFGIIIDTFAELRDQKRMKGNIFKSEGVLG